MSAIPAEFYGETNPSIQFKSSPPLKTKPAGEKGAVLSKAEKKAFDKATAAGSGQKFHPVTLLSNRKFLIISGSALFLVFIIGASWYYWHQATSVSSPAPSTPAAQPVASVTPPAATPSTPLAPVVVSTSTPSANEVASTISSAATTSLVFPSSLLGNTVDSDQDGLTDAEEQLFKTDPKNAYTAGNGYSDSSNVYWLYDPTSKDPNARLIDSGLVEQYTNPVFNYKLYYPSSWSIAASDNSNRDVTFSAENGEQVEVRVFDLDPAQSFSDWFSVWAPDQKISDLVPFSTVFHYQGLRRSDYLVYYFADQRYRYVILYHPADAAAAAINYREVIKMMAHSFQPFGSSASVPSLGTTATSSVAVVASSTASSTISSTTSPSLGPLFPVNTTTSNS